MNRFITLMLLGVIGVAMLLIFFVHMNSSDAPPPPPTIVSSGETTAQQEAPARAPEAETPPAPAESLPAEVTATAPAPAPAPQAASPAPAAPAAPAPQGEARRPAAPATASVPEGSGNILDISLHFKDDGMILRIEGDGPLPAKYFILSQPERLVLDLPGSWKNLKRPDIPSNNLVKSARLGRQGNADRLVLDLAAPIKKHALNRISDKKVELYFAQ